MFTEADVRNRSKVCVIGQTVSNELFDGVNPVGREVRLNNVSFRVVGVLEKKGANMMGWDQDDILLAPWTTMKARISGSQCLPLPRRRLPPPRRRSTRSINFIQTRRSNFIRRWIASIRPIIRSRCGLPNINQILVAANDTADVPLAMRQIRSLLRDRHQARAGRSR